MPRERGALRDSKSQIADRKEEASNHTMLTMDGPKPLSLRELRVSSRDSLLPLCIQFAICDLRFVIRARSARDQPAVSRSNAS
jgi:hypothetical protein